MGGGIGFILSRTKYTFWLKFGQFVHLSIGLLVLLSLIPGVGVGANGATRWISLGAFSIQPSEFMKYTTVMASIYFFEHFTTLDSRQKGIGALTILVPVLLLVAPTGLWKFLYLLYVNGVCGIS